MTAQDLINLEATAINAVAAGETVATEDAALLLSLTNLWIDNLNLAVKKALAANYDSSLYTFIPVAEFANLGATITLPSGWTRALMFKVAVDAAPHFGRQVGQDLQTLAQQALAAVVSGS